MKKFFFIAAILILGFFVNLPVFAETLPVLVLTPSSNSFSTSAEFNSTYPARTYGDDNDIWTFDLTAFDHNYLVSIDLTLGDYCCDADNYELFWDGSSIGETGIAVQKLFELDVSAAIHTLEIDWLNPIRGGSWYNISIEATQSTIPTSAVPVPAAVWLMGSGLVGLLGFSRKSKVRSVS